MIKTKYLVFLIFTGNKVQLHDLFPNTSYVFNVRARNDVGYGNFISVPVTTSPPSKSASSTLFQRYIWYIALVFYYRRYSFYCFKCLLCFDAVGWAAGRASGL